MKNSILIVFIIITCTACINENNPNLNGGYSWWSGPFISQPTSDESIVLVTGVLIDKKRSAQWVAKVKLNELNEYEIQEKIILNRHFKADEHNAPAIITTENNNIVIAASGHNEQKKLYIYTGSTVNNLKEHTITSPEFTTYVQLVEFKEHLILFTRLENKGFSYIVSEDQGYTWSNWQYLFQSGYVKATTDVDNDQIHFIVGSNPATPHNDISYVSTYLNGDYLTPIETVPSFNKYSQIRTNQISTIVDVTDNSAARLLSSTMGNQFIFVYTEHLIPQNLNHDETWQLNIAIKDDNSWKTASLANNLQGALGDRANPLNSGFYVYGANTFEDETGIHVIYITQEGNENKMHMISLDSSTYSVIAQKLLLSSRNEIYRPTSFLLKDGKRVIMYNEASFWYTYVDWSARQKLFILEQP